MQIYFLEIHGVFKLSTCDFQDVLLLYYTPWCGYCQALQPVLLIVARFFQNMSDVIIARYSFRRNMLVHGDFSLLLCSATTAIRPLKKININMEWCE